VKPKPDNQVAPPAGKDPAPLADSTGDPVIDLYMKDVDRTQLRENLKLTFAERGRRMQDFMRSREALRGLAARQSLGRRTG
jgi:hypothetical protein